MCITVLEHLSVPQAHDKAWGGSLGKVLKDSECCLGNTGWLPVFRMVYMVRLQARIFFARYLE